MGQVVRSRLPVCRAMHGNGRYVKLERKYRFLPRSGTKYFFPPLAGGWRFEGRRRSGEDTPPSSRRSRAAEASEPPRSSPSHAEGRSNQAAIPGRVDARNALFGPNR
jgi:hypothetical protein